MRRPLLGHDEIVARWVEERMGLKFLGLGGAIGVLDEAGKLIGGHVLHNHSKYDVELTSYGPESFSPTLVRLIAFLAYRDLDCRRMTARVPRRNKPLVRALPKFGFRHEGLVRRLYGLSRMDDALLFGMLESEATRFLKGFENERSRAA